MKILITGTSSGIGRATALKFLEEGHEVYGLDVQNATIHKASYTHFVADVTDPSCYPALEPEVLINIAGVQGLVEDGQNKDIDVNLKALVALTEFYCFEDFKTPKPNIKSVVNVGSASGHTGSEFPEYAAAKGGVLAYTKNVANRLAPQGICNSIDPGGVTTDLNRPVMDDPALWEQIMALTPLKRWATPEEIAEWIYFVAVINRFMTGQNLLIDGGEAGASNFIWPE